MCGGAGVLSGDLPFSLLRVFPWTTFDGDWTPERTVVLIGVRSMIDRRNVVRISAVPYPVERGVMVLIFAVLSAAVLFPAPHLRVTAAVVDGLLWRGIL